MKNLKGFFPEPDTQIKNLRVLEQQFANFFLPTKKDSRVLVVLVIFPRELDSDVGSELRMEKFSSHGE